MMKGLETQMKSQMRERIEETIARSKGISIEEATQYVKTMSFSEYQAISEATENTQVGQQSVQTTGQDVESPFNDKGEIDPTKRNFLKKGIDASFDGKNVQVKNVFGNEVELDNGDGTTTKAPIDRLNSPLDDTEQGTLGKLGSTAKQTGSNFVQGFRKGLNDDVDNEELNRIRELAGIEETSTAGATCAGGIASMPSIVGDTSDSHKPTNKLKTKNRLKRERKALKKNQD